MSEELEQTFAKMVAAMRAAQKRYFRDHTQQALIEAKQLEKAVDVWLDGFNP